MADAADIVRIREKQLRGTEDWVQCQVCHHPAVLHYSGDSDTFCFIIGCDCQ